MAGAVPGGAFCGRCEPKCRTVPFSDASTRVFARRPIFAALPRNVSGLATLKKRWHIKALAARGEP